MHKLVELLNKVVRCFHSAVRLRFNQASVVLRHDPHPPPLPPPYELRLLVFPLDADTLCC